MEERNWKELNTDCLAKVFERVGLESLVLDVPFVCKSWYKASLNSECWKTLLLPFDWTELYRFLDRFMEAYQKQEMACQLCLTALVKLVVSRSRGSAVNVLLTGYCRLADLEIVSNECPALKALGLHYNLVQECGEHTVKLLSKWKDLQQFHLGSTRVLFKEVLTEISLNCKNFNGLSVSGFISNEEASAIATLLPKIKYLWLRATYLPRECLKIILKGCKDLVLLDARNCCGFEAEDEEILKMASHIKTFMVEGSHLEYKEDDIVPNYKDACIFDDYGSE